MRMSEICVISDDSKTTERRTKSSYGAVHKNDRETHEVQLWCRRTLIEVSSKSRGIAAHFRVRLRGRGFLAGVRRGVDRVSLVASWHATLGRSWDERSP